MEMTELVELVLAVQLGPIPTISAQAVFGRLHRNFQGSFWGRLEDPAVSSGPQKLHFSDLHLISEIQAVTTFAPRYYALAFACADDSEG